jgi:protein TonB
LNGEAISLPKPLYPQTAVILNLQGTVKVQITIDENGRVVSSKAAEGHPLFRQVAEQAARIAKFKPTLLNGEPVKVTGVIVYHFKRN